MFSTMKLVRFLLALSLGQTVSSFQPLSTLVVHGHGKFETAQLDSRLFASPDPEVEKLREELVARGNEIAGGVLSGMPLRQHQRIHDRCSAEATRLLKSAIMAPVETPGSVTISYTDEGSRPNRETFDLVVLCANPEELGDAGIVTLTDDEKSIYDSFQHFTFQTTLFKFKPIPKNSNSVRFNPGQLYEQNGSVYGYRSETRKTFQGLPCNAEYELVTVYQLLDSKNANLTTDGLYRLLVKELEAQEAAPVDKTWFPYKFSEGELVGEPFNTKYFNHFGAPELRDAKPWELFDLQGQHNTINLHGSCCFESVLHIYQYMNLIAEERPEIFPGNRKSARIAIIGAGPSGLLAARKLTRMGYSGRNIVMFEPKANNVNPDGKMTAGKTQTRTQIQLGKHIPAELGTCYLSPAYNEMVKDLADILEGNTRISFDQTPYPFRAIVTADQFAPNGPVMTLWNKRKGKLFDDVPPGPDGKFPSSIDFEVYKLVKAFEETANMNRNLELQYLMIEETIAVQAGKYMIYHIQTFGTQRPMPAVCPEELQNEDDLGGWTISEFLEKKGLKGLTGILQYSYSVQGYGALDGNMPAWYLLTWVTPQAFRPTEEASIKGLAALCTECRFDEIFGPVSNDQSTVTAWSKGWGDVWRQQKNQLARLGVTTHYSSTVNSIARSTISSHSYNTTQEPALSATM